jgi:hypothetical protein
MQIRMVRLEPRRLPVSLRLVQLEDFFHRAIENTCESHRECKRWDIRSRFQSYDRLSRDPRLLRQLGLS